MDLYVMKYRFWPAAPRPKITDELAPSTHFRQWRTSAVGNQKRGNYQSCRPPQGGCI